MSDPQPPARFDPNTGRPLNPTATADEPPPWVTQAQQPTDAANPGIMDVGAVEHPAPVTTLDGGTGEGATYTVKPGDTLTSIATALYGHPSNWTLLMAANSDNDALKDADGFFDPERAGFMAPLEVPGTILRTDLDRHVPRQR